MCVGLPARVVSIKEGTALVDASGAKREVSAELLDQLDPGDYVMVHAGAAIARITADDEEETDALLDDISFEA
ncbi:MAG: HypC/HybG/HupF family hydrogenase formation chaperone [Eubacteriales bacterium]|jgi:hydrogenase expression/formation protein HypC|nr:HypC/HybG/HupF family hydrogenase formation chaperone [Eubacteriales bacterium]